MADNSRIEDLRKRYHENPRRFFAPLANEYRKSGFLDRALLLCQKHVPEQPENMNGLVVYGQTLFELGQTEAAREPFTQALALDPENLIALRHLGDVARLLGDVPAAKGWYEKVLELDRRNDEVLELIAQLDGPGEAPSVEAPSAPMPRASTAAGGLVSVAPTVSVSGADDIGMIDLGPPSPAPAAPPAGKGGTVVINAQALADRDRRDAELPRDVTQPVAAVQPLFETTHVEPPLSAPPVVDAPPAELPAAEAPAPRPSKRASLLDIDFDFSETAEPEPAKPVPQAPLLGAEAAEYGFADIGLDPTIAAPTPTPAPEAPAADLELAEFSTEVSPLAGLEATEFSSESVAPIAELEADSVSMSMPSVMPLDGLDRPDAVAEPVAAAPQGFDGLADLPLLEDASAEAASLELPSIDPPTLDINEPVESPSARPRPRMTKADLASLPLLADFGLEDDSAGASAAEPPAEVPARTAKTTPTFVTETMAALYVQQGLLHEAIGVYRQLVDASPADAGLKAKLAELERMHEQAAAPAPAAAAADEMPEFEAPVDAQEPEPAPANAALADVSFGAIGLQGQGTPTPIVTPAVPAGPTAREFFANFARRAAVAAAVAAPMLAAAPAAEAVEYAEPATAASVPAGAWPLDALFGAANDVRDLHAAETLAGLGSFAGPSGASGLDELLSGAEAPARRAVPRASEMLNFDQFFQKPGTTDPAAAAAAPEAAPGDDDLDQFQDWLKGLKK